LAGDAGGADRYIAVDGWEIAVKFDAKRYSHPSPP
jgi:hypothetical protein